MNCNHCKNSYNLNNRLPIILPDCGHSLCSDCLNNLKSTSKPNIKCPYDNLLYPKSTEFKNNLYFIQKLKENNFFKEKKETCKFHDRFKELYCLDCQCEVCSDCILFDNHKDHKYEQIKKLKDINEKKNLKQIEIKLKDLKKKFQNIFPSINLKIDEFEKKQYILINEKFDNIKLKLIKIEKTKLDCLKKIFETYHNDLKIYNDSLNNFEKKLTSEKNVELNLLKTEINELEEKSDNLTFKKVIDKYNFEIKFENQILEKLENFCSIKTSKIIEQKSSSTLEQKSQEEKLLLLESLQDLIKNSNESKKYSKKSSKIMEINIQTPNKLKLNPKKKRFFYDKEFNTPLSKKLEYNNIDSSLKKKNQRMNRTAQKSCTSLLNIKNSNLRPKILKGRILKAKKDLNPFSNNDIKNLKRSKSKIHIRKKSFIASPSPSPNKFTSSRQNSILICNKENEKLPNFEKNKSVSKKINFKSIFENIERKNLVTLNLTNLRITDKILVSLSPKIKKLKSLKTIKIERNKITDIGLKYLLKNIKENKVEFIFLNENNLKENAIDYLISFRKYNQYLKAVYMEKSSINTKSHIVQSKVELLESKKLMLIL